MSTDALREATALKLFDKYFAENYPGPHTIISDPHWHAPKIFRAMLSCLKEAAPASGTKCPHGHPERGLTCGPECQPAASETEKLPALSLEDVLSALEYASEGRSWSGPKPDLLGNELNRIIRRKLEAALKADRLGGNEKEHK